MKNLQSEGGRDVGPALEDPTISCIPKSIPARSKTGTVAFQIHINTASNKPAGTDKHVYVQLSGDSGITEFVLLDDASSNISESGMRYASPEAIDPDQHSYGFPSGSVRDFGFEAACVENITNILLKHDPNGHQQSAWRPENIIVANIYLQRAWVFSCPKWLSADEGNQINLKPDGVVYAGRRSYRRASQALLMLKSDSLEALLHSDASNPGGDGIKTFDNPVPLQKLRDTGVRTIDVGTKRVRFQLQKFTKTNAHVYRLGNIGALGEWNPEKAIRMSMKLSPDGVWRGSWEVHLELDEDIDDIKYNYLTITESGLLNHRRVIVPGDVHMLDLSASAHSERHANDGCIVTRDSYGSNRKEQFEHENIGSKLEPVKEETILQRNEQKRTETTENNLIKHYSFLPRSEEDQNILERSTGKDSEKIVNEKKEYLGANIPRNEDYFSQEKLKEQMNASEQRLRQAIIDFNDQKSEVTTVRLNIEENVSSASPASMGDTDDDGIDDYLLLLDLQSNLEEIKRTSIDRCEKLRHGLEDIQTNMKCFHDFMKEENGRMKNLLQARDKCHFRNHEKLIEENAILQKRWAKEFEERRNLFNQIQDMRGNIRVFCRVRPLKDSYLRKEDKIPDLHFTNDLWEEEHIHVGEKNFRFDKVFAYLSTQEEIYESTAGVVTSVLDGYNVCVMAYGQTGSRKTFTMNGTEEDRGVNYRAVKDLFSVAMERSSHVRTFFSISALEIYNEFLRDLLASGEPDKKLEIRKDTRSSSENNIYIQNITKVNAESAEMVWGLMEKATRNRTNGNTRMNETSSRSHLIIKVHVICEEMTKGSRTSGDLTLVDLAGSERVNRSNVTGKRLKEAQHVNKSLSTLGDVFNALISKSSHIPFRNSKLTYLLQDCIGGPSKTLMFVNISSNKEDLSETLSSLEFSQRAAKVEFGRPRKTTASKKESNIQKSIKSTEKKMQELLLKYENCEKEVKKKLEIIEAAQKKTEFLEQELKRARQNLQESRKRERGHGR